MSKELVLKELRENAIIAALAVVVFLGIVGLAVGLPVVPWAVNSSWREIPFIGPTFLTYFTVAAVGTAMALGFHQSLGDSWGSVYLFLLHRPISRHELFSTKLLVGLALYSAISALPIVLLAVWAAAPGTHASPFEWDMTWPVWRLWIVISLVYLGAFLSGIRSANWFGSRLAPLATAGMMTVACAATPVAGAGLVVWILVLALYTWLILLQGASRDFS